jgi:ureidoglycolate lyase
MTERVVRAETLTAAAFAPFGDVIETSPGTARWINDNTCVRYDDLARVDVSREGGRPLISIFEAEPRSLPFPVHMLERHPLSSQAFFPLDARPFLVVVAEDGPLPLADRIKAYLAAGMQGVNYRRNTWHHPLIALDLRSRFLVIDRGGPGSNCEEINITNEVVLVTTEGLC